MYQAQSDLLIANYRHILIASSFHDAVVILLIERISLKVKYKGAD